MSGSISLTPWARNHITDEEHAEILASADVLDAGIVATHSRGGWTVHANGRGCRAAVYQAKGRLAVAMLSTLHDLRMQYDMLDDDFTPEELAALRRQSERAA